jgi:Na+-driven multidrug efflux pump
MFSAMFTVNGVMRGAGDTLIPMFITLFSLWVIRIPTSYLLSLRLGVNGIWWGIPVAWFLGMTLTYLYYLSNRWKKKGIIKRNVS